MIAIEAFIPSVDQLLKLVLAVVIGGMIGLERQMSHKPAGLRTHIMVCVGAAVATMSAFDFFTGDPARIPAAIVTGMGFLGAGTIIGAKDHVIGLTTAASVWVIAVLGIVVGAGAYGLALATGLLLLFTLISLRKIEAVL